MNRQLYIINNSLRDRRGHYFETSLAIAEAARDAGLHPIVGAHADCPADLFPAWLECYSLFTTDHWMTEGPADRANLSALEDPQGHAPRIDIDRVLRCESSVRDYVKCRLSAGPRELPPRADGMHVRRMIRRFVRKAEDAAYRFLPATAYDSLKRLYRHGRDLVCSTAFRRSATVQTHPPEAGTTNKVDTIGNDHEYAQLFRHDLACLLRLTGARADDLVLLGTAHGRELLAIQEMLREGPGDWPTFHLEFRHPVFAGNPEDPMVRNATEVQRWAAFFNRYRQQGIHPRIRFHTDTAELSAEYAGISGFNFGVLPIPFRSRLLVESESPPPEQPLCLTFLGDARDEKGFHWFPALIDNLHRDQTLARKVRFRLQATPGIARFNPQSTIALKKLASYPPALVESVGLQGPLTDAEYYGLLSSAQIVLLPYDRFRYRAASSGTLTEAIAAGKPTVVPAATWMAAQQPAGSGATFTDLDSFIAAVRHVISHYAECRQRAEQSQSAWRKRHSPAALVDALLVASPPHELSAAA